MLRTSWLQPRAASQPAPRVTLQNKFEALIERYETHARELGWARTGREEQEGRSAVDIGGSRAELVLLEQEANGPLGLDEATLAAALEDTLRRRALALPAGAFPPGGDPARAPWRWNWRRTAALASLAALIGLPVTARIGHAMWELWAALASGAVLLALGPWVPQDIFRSCAGLWAEFKVWLRARKTIHALEREIHQRESEILTAAARRSRAGQWVGDRLDVISRRYETERSRAEMASRAVRGEQVPGTDQATRRNSH